MLREKKKLSTKYTFTREQLEQHDMMLINDRKDFLKREIAEKLEKEFQEKNRMIDERIAKIDELVQKEWDKRAEVFQSGTNADQFYALLQYLLSISVRVLVEHFGWSPIPADRKASKNQKLVRFTEYLEDEINKISADEMMDIRRYCDETYELYGIRFARDDTPPIKILYLEVMIFGEKSFDRRIR